jgi:large repetitive protein
MKPSLFLLLLVLSMIPCVAVASVSITTQTIPTGNADTSYSAVIHASGGCTPYKWAITSGKLPAGITDTVESTTTALELTGKPTTVATYTFTVSVTGCSGPAETASFTLVVFPALLTITTPSLPNGTVETAYTATIDGTGGCTPYKWAISSGSLPAGVTGKVSSSTTVFTLSGTPTTAASYPFTVSLTGCGGHSDTATYKVAIQGSAKNVVNLSWKASTSSEVAGYNVYRSPNGSTWTKLNSGLIASTLYSDSTVAADSTYWYAATTVNTSGEESNKTPSVKAVIP